MQKNYNGAYAIVKGGEKYPDINGLVTFNQMERGTLVTAKVYGLPTKSGECSGGVFAFHIHEGDTCETKKGEEEFAGAKTHYNPTNCPHPYHAGDLPPLFSNDGYAYMQILTNRFTVKEIIGKVVIIHDKPDDFTTQPSGNSGTKIACGKIGID